jgi:exodeoxyribonuclease III
MKLLSLNCNGIRSAFTKGLDKWLLSQDFDIICFQEIKALPKDINLPFFESLGYFYHLFPAEKKGYSGTAIFSKLKSKKELLGTGHELFDSEGRIILLEFEKFSLFNCYFPSGTSGDSRQKVKMQFLDYMQNYLDAYKQKKKSIILCGDINIAHTEMDIHNPKGNEKNSGFLPEERTWVTNFLNSGWVDSFRFQNPETRDVYSWWTYRFSARSNNKGWRIDYFFVTQNLRTKIIKTKIFTDQIFSDHAPIYLEMSF